jgi:hypothetical protein
VRSQETTFGSHRIHYVEERPGTEDRVVRGEERKNLVSSIGHTTRVLEQSMLNGR